MKHFKDLFSILCLLFITSAFVACDDDNDEYATDDETILSVPQDDLIFTYEGEAKTINVTASENTFVASVTTGDETWAHVSTANNSVKIVVDENVDQQERSTTLTVKLNGEILENIDIVNVNEVQKRDWKDYFKIVLNTYGNWKNFIIIH